MRPWTMLTVLCTKQYAWRQILNFNKILQWKARRSEPDLGGQKYEQNWCYFNDAGRTAQALAMLCLQFFTKNNVMLIGSKKWEISQEHKIRSFMIEARQITGYGLGRNGNAGMQQCQATRCYAYRVLSNLDWCCFTHYCSARTTWFTVIHCLCMI